MWNTEFGMGVSNELQLNVTKGSQVAPLLNCMKKNNIVGKITLPPFPLVEIELISFYSG